MALATTTLPPVVSARAHAAAYVERSSLSSRRSIPARGLVAICDVGAVMTTLGLILALRTVNRWPDRISGFLSLYISVQDLVLVIGVAAVTFAIFAAVGLYDAAPVRRWGAEIGRGVFRATALAGPPTAPLPTRQAP